MFYFVNSLMPFMLDCHFTDHSASLSVVLQLGTLYQQPFNTYRHHHPVSAAVGKLKYN